MTPSAGVGTLALSVASSVLTICVKIVIPLLAAVSVAKEAYLHVCVNRRRGVIVQQVSSLGAGNQWAYFVLEPCYIAPSDTKLCEKKFSVRLPIEDTLPCSAQSKLQHGTRKGDCGPRHGCDRDAAAQAPVSAPCDSGDRLSRTLRSNTLPVQIRSNLGVGDGR